MHVRKDNGAVFYIGYGSPRRPYDSCMRNRWWHIIVKYCGYETKVVITGLSPVEAKSWEKYLINLYGRRSDGKGNLVNMTDGGDGAVNSVCSDELREFHRQRMLGRKMSEESRRKLSESRMGKYAGPNAYMYGKHHTEETRRKIAERHKGRPVSEEHRKKISQTLKGKFAGENAFRGSKVIDTATGKIYHTIKLAAELHGINPSTLRAMLDGELKNKTTLKRYAEKTSNPTQDQGSV